ncbi:MAG: GTPase ObgE [Chitinispirillales bacterium]|jgi:GTP-binding protein|nr:GTPase ObgE [Chitinispirillales bacterium]
MFIDSAKIEVISGDGGNGCFSYDRDKFKPKGKPGGGNGGRGGNIYVVASKKVQTLQDVSYRSFYKAERGGHGGANNLYGKSGADIKIPVPLGTTIRNFDTDEFIYDLTTDGEEILVAKGGRGGRGNKAMVTKFNLNPEYAEYGKAGETKTLKLTLKVMADVGLVGLPNAGKSTLLSVVSRATPEIADYPFTTLTPHLGIVKTGEYSSFVMADIPGIIEGASLGKGLGIQFLQHIERTRVLAILVDCCDENPKETAKKLRTELKSYSLELAQKPCICILTKSDTKSADEIKIPRGWFCISAATNNGVSKLVNKFSEIIGEARKNDGIVQREIVEVG